MRQGVLVIIVCYSQLIFAADFCEELFFPNSNATLASDKTSMYRWDLWVRQQPNAQVDVIQVDPEMGAQDLWDQYVNGRQYPIDPEMGAMALWEQYKAEHPVVNDLAVLDPEGADEYLWRMHLEGKDTKSTAVNEEIGKKALWFGYLDWLQRRGWLEAINGDTQRMYLDYLETSGLEVTPNGTIERITP